MIHKLFTITILTVLLSIPFVIISETNAQSATPGYQKGQILVKFKTNINERAIATAEHAKLGEAVGDTGVRILYVPTGAELKIVEALNHNPNIEFAEFDQILSAETTDTYFSFQWALNNEGQAFVSLGGTNVTAGTPDKDIDAPEAWAVTRGSGMKVAVIDSGVATDNTDITSKVVAAKNFSSATSGTEDMYGHGTHVAGTIAAITSNEQGVAGVCPDCSVVSAKVLNDQGWGASSAIANGIAWSVQQGAKVLNMSIGSDTPSKTIQAAVDNAWRNGAVLVAAAGNDGSSAKDYPAAYTNVIAVAATDNSDKRASFSNYGSKWVDVAAPGVNVYATFPCHPFAIQKELPRALCYDVANGTSMATPITAGVVALAWSMNPSANNATVRAKVELSADKIQGTGTLWSKGRVNAANAVVW